MGKAQREIPYCSGHYKPRPPHQPECPCFSWPEGLGRDPSLLQTSELEMRGEGKIPSAPFTGMSRVFSLDLDSKSGATGTQILQFTSISGKKTKHRATVATNLLCGRSGCSGYKAGLRCRSWHQMFASGNSHIAPACQLADQLSAERESARVSWLMGKQLSALPKTYLCLTQVQG